MSFMRTALMGAAAAVLAGQAFAADVTIRVAHLNPEDPFASHSGAMAAVFCRAEERIATLHVWGSHDVAVYF